MGLDVSPLGLVAPLVAVPVRRGTPRVAPGTRLPAAAPIAVACDEARTPLEVTATLQAAPRGKKAHLSIARGSGRWLVVTRR